MILLLGLLFLAAIKAGMVGWYFMHLKFEGNWVYILIVPAIILATIIVLALLPDMVLKPETEENPGEESSFVVPAIERPGSGFPLRLATTLPPAGPGASAGSLSSRCSRLRPPYERLAHREQVLSTRCSDRSRHGRDLGELVPGQGWPGSRAGGSSRAGPGCGRLSPRRFPA